LTSMHMNYRIVCMNANAKRLSVADYILEKAKANNGIITSAMLTTEGISRGHLKPLVESGKLVQATRGVYTIPEVFDDDYFNLQTRYRKGIFSGATALYLFGLTDRTPERPEMTFPRSYNISVLENQIVICRRTKLEWYELGVTEARTDLGNAVRVYNIERSLCDLVRRGSKADVHIVTDAFKKYARKKDKNLHRLSEYAKALRVEDKVRSYIEVLI